MKSRNTWIKIFIACAIILAAYGFYRAGLLQTTIRWIGGFGTTRPIVFLLVYITAAIFLIPSFLLTFAGGFLFDFSTGTALSILGCGLGAQSAFLVGRYVARDAVEKRVANIPKFQRIRTVAEKKGWKIVLLGRLSLVFPFLIGNYVFGTTRMPASHYFLASLVGTIPSALVYTYSGSLAGSLISKGPHVRTPQEYGLFALGLVATLAISFYLKKLLQAELHNTE